ncbi:MAG: Na+:solute symporter, partial [Planctomycetes bacterium]|nr:Na+:solute symporter [Planctomycetota bacterium]
MDAEPAGTSNPVNQVKHGIDLIDWGVIAIYGALMIGVGLYYSRRTHSTDDYLLGGRAMKPWAVGLSLFATLLSTISYLAIPEEMIEHGPMFIASLLAYPLVLLVVGWIFIPFFMKQKVTSAYEILELRLGLGVRMLGSFFFLSLRLAWMATIIFATTSKVLIPLLGWDVSATPYACAVLGVITVIYTSMGGIRAVVVTDVVQTFILLGGAALTVVLITVDLGGVGAWWPTEWVSTWDPPKIWFDPGSRVTVAASIMSVFTWYICTAGSDQMAIQRYLST